MLLVLGNSVYLEFRKFLSSRIEKIIVEEIEYINVTFLVEIACDHQKLLHKELKTELINLDRNIINLN